MASSSIEERVCILAPLGRDGAIARDVLRRQGLQAEVHAAVQTLFAAIDEGAGAVLLTQEALELPGFQRFPRKLGEQPAWSDLPLVLLISAGVVGPRVTRVLQVLDAHTNTTVLERPVRPETITGALSAALRSRRRQYEVRDHLQARMLADESERRARAEAEEALRARDEFLSIASHELRNPVAALSGTAQLLRRAHDDGRLTEGRLRTYIESLESAGKHLAALTNDLLDVSRLQRGELPIRPAELDLPRLLREVVERAELSERTVRLEIDQPALQAFADRDRISQVLWNLLDNAVKYSAGSGEVTVRGTAEDGGALIEVTDAGIGIPQNDLEAIFSPFGRASNATKANISGLGLGLYLSRRIVEQHGGRLWASSGGEGTGTTMSLWLPGGSTDARIKG